MTSLKVFISTAKDGSMYNRKNHTDPIVITNRERFLENNGMDIEDTTRLKVDFSGEDFCRYREVQQNEKGKGMRDDELLEADAIVTTHMNHALMLPVADCVGVVLFDPINSVLMVSHLGRHSLEQQGGTKSVEYLKAHYNSDPAELKVWLTPAAGKDVYPIWKLDNKGLKEATHEQLAAAGVGRENITDNTADTDKDPDYFSYSEFLKGNRSEDGDHMIVAMMTD